MKNKKGLIVLGSVLLLVGCSNEKTKSESGDELSFTNKYECSRVENYTKYDIEHRNGGGILTTEEMEEKKNSPVAVEGRISKVYDFNKEGSKLLAYYEIETYTYLVDVSMDEEKELYEKKCDNSKKYGYKSCEVKINDKVITLTRTLDLESEDNKDVVQKTTMDSVKSDFAEDEIFTCN